MFLEIIPLCDNNVILAVCAGTTVHVNGVKRLIVLVPCYCFPLFASKPLFTLGLMTPVISMKGSSDRASGVQCDLIRNFLSSFLYLEFPFYPFFGFGSFPCCLFCCPPLPLLPLFSSLSLLLPPSWSGFLNSFSCLYFYLTPELLRFLSRSSICRQHLAYRYIQYHLQMIACAGAKSPSVFAIRNVIHARSHSVFSSDPSAKNT